MQSTHARSSAAIAATAAEPEIFHVILTQGDQREMTLEQLDDCFRLGVVEEDTLVWTEGMSRWQTLAEAAGLEAPAPIAVPPPPRHSNSPRRAKPSHPPPRLAASGHPGQHHVAPTFSQQPSVCGVPSHAPAVHAPAHVPAVHVPAVHAPAHVPAVHAPAQAPAVHAPTPAAPVTASGTYPRAAAPVAQATPAVAVSEAPNWLTEAPPPREPLDSSIFGGQTGRWRRKFQSMIMLSALLAASVIILYRNDILLQGAQRINQEQAYLELEQRWLGGPPHGVPRQVHALTQALSTTPSEAVTPPNTVSPIKATEETTTRRAEPAPSTPPSTAEKASKARGPGSDEKLDARRPKATNTPQAAEPPPAGARHTRARRASPNKVERVRTSKAPVTKPRKQASSSEKASAKAADDQPAPDANALNMNADDFLNWSIRNAVKKSKNTPGSGKKKKSKRNKKKKRNKSKRSKNPSDYDPLNGNL